MPNIEVHGFEKAIAEEWKKAILELFKDSDIEDDIYVTVFDSRTTHSSGRDAPFLRLFSTEDTIHQARQTLKKLGIDLEKVVAIEFDEGTEKFDRTSPPPKLVV